MKDLPINQIIQGDALKVLKTFPDESIDCVVTSPPYWMLRDYGVEGQIGLEPTLQEYINKLCQVFDKIKRVLKKTGTCWVNMGDTYIRKCLSLIPSRFAIEMINRGWILRNEIIWHKPNCMPQSVKDRFTVDFEKVFFFVKNKKYWFEQQFESNKTPVNKNIKWEGKKDRNYPFGISISSKNTLGSAKNELGRNKRCVWSIPTKPFKDAHFAVYPEKLVEPMIKAGCPIGGIVLDPFIGSGTTAVVAKKLGRNYIGIELNPDYIKIANKRLSQQTLL